MKQSKKTINILGNIANVLKSELGKIKFFASAETNDYSAFHFFPGNRKVKEANIRKMVESIASIGVMRYVIVCSTAMFDGIKRNYIIDGQHLYSACMQLKIPFRYIIVEGVDDYNSLINITKKLNSTGVKWTLDNHIDASAQAGKWDYKKLKEFKEQQKISYSVLLPLLTGKSLSIAKKEVYDGNFKITRLQETIQFLSQRSLIGNYIKESRYADEGLLTFTMSIKNNVKWPKLLAEMQSRESKLRQLPTFGKREEAEALFIDLYRKALKRA